MKQNIEQLEALQEEINAKDAEFYKTLSDSDKKKKDAVGKAMDILTEANVPTIMFCKIPIKKQENICETQHKLSQIQYNNWFKLLDLFETMDLSEEQAKTLTNLETGFVMSIYSQFLEIFEQRTEGIYNEAEWSEKINAVFNWTFERMRKEEEEKE